MEWAYIQIELFTQPKNGVIILKLSNMLSLHSMFLFYYGPYLLHMNIFYNMIKISAVIVFRTLIAS